MNFCIKKVYKYIFFIKQWIGVIFFEMYPSQSLQFQFHNLLGEEGGKLCSNGECRDFRGILYYDVSPLTLYFARLRIKTL